MKDLKTSIVESLDGDANHELYPFLPYILQDIEEIGTDPLLVEQLIRTHIGSKPLNVLDLGCGKGAVSIHLARQLGCHITGIDGMQEFIDAAITSAEKYGVLHLCNFHQGDIRTEITNCKDFDVLILGAIGPVFGFIGETLRAIAPALNPGGFVIIDDGYKEDSALPDYDKAIEKSVFYREITENDFVMVDEIIIPANDLAQANRDIQDCIVKRANELATQHPEKKHLFKDYVQAQEEEIDTMENHLVVGIWLLRKC